MLGLQHVPYAGQVMTRGTRSHASRRRGLPRMRARRRLPRSPADYTTVTVTVDPVYAQPRAWSTRRERRQRHPLSQQAVELIEPSPSWRRLVKALRWARHQTGGNGRGHDSKSWRASSRDRRGDGHSCSVWTRSLRGFVVRRIVWRSVARVRRLARRSTASKSGCRNEGAFFHSPVGAWMGAAREARALASAATAAQAGSRGRIRRRSAPLRGPTPTDASPRARRARSASTRSGRSSRP